MFHAVSISIHALHEESDKNNTPKDAKKTFQSTLSMRRATQRQDSCRKSMNISIHALHEESDARGLGKTYGAKISIHALHEESDVI